MKNLMISVALLGATASAPAFAQSNPSNDQKTAATQTAAVSQTGQRVAPYGQPVAGKTRAQDYQELVQAQQDGQIAYLKSLFRGR
jgi:hypothetical protein